MEQPQNPLLPLTMQLLFATHNNHKAAEVQAVLPPPFRVQSLKQYGFQDPIPEPHDTLHANAAEKARTVFARTGQWCFSEDTGLEVDALGGAPGVHTARFAGPDAGDGDNRALLLQRLAGQTLRKARFRTVICLLQEGAEHYFEGVCEGRIAESEKGASGFGYDAVFIPEGDNRTFAEMSAEEKNKVSHRRKAVDGLVEFLSTLAHKPND